MAVVRRGGGDGRIGLGAGELDPADHPSRYGDLPGAAVSSRRAEGSAPDLPHRISRRRRPGDDLGRASHRRADRSSARRLQIEAGDARAARVRRCVVPLTVWPERVARSAHARRYASDQEAGRQASSMVRPAMSTVWRVVMLVALAMPAATSFASSRTPAAAPPAPPPAEEKSDQASVPIPEVARQADDVAKLLRDFDALLVLSPAGEAAEKRLPEISARIAAQTPETSQAIESGVTATLDGMTTQWQTIRAELVGYVN